MIETGTVLQNRYLIEQRIGAGGMGAVYLAIDQRFESRVAIKQTFYNEADLRDAFEREARLLNTLHHPILPHVSDYFTEGNGHFLVMEYIEGEDLSEILKRRGAFEFKDVLSWTDSLLDALDYLHSQETPIIHRDIKPNNLKITPRGDIVLLDFGLAKLNSNENTGIQSIFGYSRRYSPLEQIQGTGTDARSDIFALGATVYHLLTGKPPIDTLARAAAIIAGESDPLRLACDINEQIPVQFAQVLQAALALNADRRFVSAKAMRAALEHAASLNQTVSKENISGEIVAAAALEPKQTEIPSETENFPALEAFAADVVENSAESQHQVKSTSAIHMSMEDAEALLSASEIPHNLVSRNKAVAAAAAPKHSRINDRLLTIVAAIAAILIWGGLGLWFLTTEAARSLDQPKTENVIIKPTPAIKKTAPPPAAAPAEVLPTLNETLPIIPEEEEISPVKTSTKTSSELKKQSVSSPRAKTENNETVERNQTKKSDTPAETKPAAQPTNPRRSSSSSSSNGETRPRVVQQPSVSNIERVITGSAPQKEQQREGVRRRRWEMSEAEKEELRQRRTESVLRRNRQPMP